MGMCKPSGGIEKIYGPYGRNIKEIINQTPNSRIDYYDEKTGKLLQQRWFDADGKAGTETGIIMIQIILTNFLTIIIGFGIILSIQIDLNIKGQMEKI